MRDHPSPRWMLHPAVGLDGEEIETVCESKGLPLRRASGRRSLKVKKQLFENEELKWPDLSGSSPLVRQVPGSSQATPRLLPEGAASPTCPIRRRFSASSRKLFGLWHQCPEDQERDRGDGCEREKRGLVARVFDDQAG